MVSIAKRSFSALVAVVFGVYSLLLPVQALAYVAATNLAISGLSSGAVLNTSASVTSGAINASAVTTVAGRSVVMPAAMRLAANAPQLAVTAVRASPAGLLTTAVVSWLVPYGLEWLNSQWQKKTTGADIGTCVNGSGYTNYNYTFAQCVANNRIGIENAFGAQSTTVTQNAANGNSLLFYDLSDGVTRAWGAWTKSASGSVSYVPAQESDWTAPAAAALPDAAATDLVKKIALPVDQVTIAPGDYAVSEPRIDPVTGRKVQDYARITPTPNADSLRTGIVPAQAEVFTRDVDTATGTAAQTAPVPQKFPDDYNREATQQKTLEELQAANAPAKPDWDTSVKTQSDAAKKEITDKTDVIPTQFDGDKAKWFSWVWTPPVGACKPFTGTVHSLPVSWDICNYVNGLRDVIGWLMSIGGAWAIYNEMFRKEEGA